MPPRTKFDRENVVDAAVRIAKKGGLSAITARAVAEELGSSVAPIYANFSNIDDLIAAAVERVMRWSYSLIEASKARGPLEKIGAASIAFARRYPLLFRDLTLQPNDYMGSYDVLEGQILKLMGADERLNRWTEEERRRLLFKMRVVQMGLCTMVAMGHIPQWLGEGEVDEMLYELGEDLILATRAKRGENTE
ncbi:MAG: TetR family transcriptional regulator [Bacillota bacterium]